MGPSTDSLDTDIQYLRGVGPKLAKLLRKKGIATLEDALFFMPRAYEDRRALSPLARLTPGQPATVLGKVESTRVWRKGRQQQMEVVLVDRDGGRLILYWFRAYPSIVEEFKKDATFLVYGDVQGYKGIPRITHPEYEKVEELREGGKPPTSVHFGRVVPVYSETEGLHQKTLRRLMAEALKTSLPRLSESLPADLRQRLHLLPLRDSFISIHFPQQVPEEGQLTEAMRRIVFEEFFVLQLGVGLKKKQLQTTPAPVFADENGLVDRFIAVLPFPLTGDQRKVIDEIRSDLRKGQPMTRLIQGDVGSGKTVVALAAAVLAASAGYQTAFMVPTEILAQQHYRAAVRWLEALGQKSALVVGAQTDRGEMLERVRTGAASLIIGTHALFQAGIEFKKLGLVVVDEQHRFGVEQRAELIRKGQAPHLLLMTATPIPRTLALTLYGDLDLSVIREKPAGRQPIRTRLLRDRERPALYKLIRETVARGEQVYVIYPLVEASEKLELKSATEMHARLSREVFPDLSIALVHGRLKGEEKDRILAEFKAKKYSVLIATTVVEVGIDVPNATLMVVEHPERLGLSQLHQLRGRVGRGDKPSECILMCGDFITPRLRVMTRSEDGFVIAEEDLKIRGPGEFLGTRQSGLPGFRAGDLLRDAELLGVAKDEADRLLATDPELALAENQGIRGMVENRWKDKIERLRGG